MVEALKQSHRNETVAAVLCRGKVNAGLPDIPEVEFRDVRAVGFSQLYDLRQGHLRFPGQPEQFSLLLPSYVRS